MKNELLSTKAISYSEREKYFDMKDGKYVIKNWCKRLGLHPFLFPDKFTQHLTPKERYSCWIGGNSSGKSTSKARYFIMRLLEKEHCRVLFLRHHHSDNRSTTFLTLTGVIKKEGLEDRFHTLDNPMVIICKDTGNMLVSGGLDQTGKFSGLEDFSDVWFEEPITRSDGKIKMISEEQFVDLDSRLRMPKTKLTMHLTLNPINKKFFLYTGLLDPELKEADRLYDIKKWNICNSTYKDNPFLEQDAIDVVENFKGERREYGTRGEWANEKTGNEWVCDFNKDKHIKDVPYIMGVEVNKGFDFNMLPYQTCIDTQCIRKKDGRYQIRVFKEYCMKPPLNSPENACKFFIQDFIETYGYNTVSVFGDASGRYGYDNYYGIFKELERYTHEGSDMVLKKNPPVRIARDLINEIMRGEHGIDFVIDKECVNLINDFETMQTSPDGFDPAVVKGVETKGHCYSAFSYTVCVVFDYLMKHNQRS